MTTENPTTEATRSNLKILVRGAYDIQKLRIQTGNRVVANFKAKLGQEPSQSEDTLSEEAKEVLRQLRTKNKKITDGVAEELEASKDEKLARKLMAVIKQSYAAHTEGSEKFPTPAKFKGDAIISDYTELCLLEQYLKLEEDENSHFGRLKYVLRDYPIYTQFLEGVKGVGPAMAGVIISEIDIRKATYASSIWAYGGLDTGPDGRGRSRRKEHLVTSTYTNKAGETAEKVGITFNPFLKTKLTGVLGPSFLRAGDNKYSQIYRDYKHRLENRPDCKELTKAHLHSRSIRYMVKLFLADLYAEWRRIEGLPVHAPYHEEKLGIFHKKVA